MLFLGYDTLEAYVSEDCYLGATIGRVANRIKGASFQLTERLVPSLLYLGIT